MRILLLLLLSTSLVAAEVKSEKIVTKDEFVQKAAERFDRIDTNNDGVLSKAERKTWREARPERVEARKQKREEMKSQRKEKRANRKANKK